MGINRPLAALSVRSALSIPILALSFFSANAIAAGKNDVARCIDANGDVTYTDFYCETTEKSNPMLMTENAIERPVRRDHRYDIFSNNRNPDREGYGQDSHITPNKYGQDAAMAAVKSGAIAPMRLTTITRNAADRCSKHVTRFFRHRHPDVSNVPAIEFNEVEDQFINGPNVSVTIRATVEYNDHSARIHSYIDCTAQKFSSNSKSDWKVGYLER